MKNSSSHRRLRLARLQCHGLSVLGLCAAALVSVVTMMAHALTGFRRAATAHLTCPAMGSLAPISQFTSCTVSLEKGWALFLKRWLSHPRSHVRARLESRVCSVATERRARTGDSSACPRDGCGGAEESPRAAPADGEDRLVSVLPSVHGQAERKGNSPVERAGGPRRSRSRRPTTRRRTRPVQLLEGNTTCACAVGCCRDAFEYANDKPPQLTSR
jgi:hypothetical protein